MTNCIYIHIPFCYKKCNYCAFSSFENLNSKDSYINALIKEITHYYNNSTLKTLYFGGGTPSILDAKDIENILKCFNCDNKTEVTIEANPYNLALTKLQELKHLGFNRISLGVQSFDDNLLKTIGRIHTTNDVYTTINNIKKAGFTNYSIDLIYGLPKQSIKLWENTLKKALQLAPNHISLYGLKIEKGTYFYKNTPDNLPDFDAQAEMYEKAIEILNDNYLHYEFSNFAKNENYISCHNTAYWKRENYWGFGLSASGFVENKRYTNTTNLYSYIKDPIQKQYDTLTTQQQIEEELFLGLRLYDGIDFDKINKKYNIDIYNRYKKIFDKFLNYKLMKLTDKGIKLTCQGILVSNEILSDFIDI